METIYMCVISVFILFFYIRMSYYFYKKDKRTDTSLVINLTYLFFVVALFVFPYVCLLGKLGEQLNFSEVECLRHFGGYLLGSVYILGISGVMLAFCLLFLIGITLIIKLLSDFLEY